MGKSVSPLPEAAIHRIAAAVRNLLPAPLPRYKLTWQQMGEGRDETDDCGVRRGGARHDGGGRSCGDKAPSGKGSAGLRCADFPCGGFGCSDGEQQAGFYRSRYGTLALHADVKGGQPADYFVLADGKRLAAAPAALPDWAVSCAAEKKLPKPAAAGTSPCTGQQFRVALAHVGNERLALLYGFDGSTWHYCGAGAY